MPMLKYLAEKSNQTKADRQTGLDFAGNADGLRPRRLLRLHYPNKKRAETGL